MEEPTISETRDLRLILGLKLKSLRQERGASLKEISEQAGVSVSYLSELEQGKKYPKPQKLLRLAAALDVSYDELVSLKVTDELGPIKEAVSSGLLREFPFELFGLEREDLVRMISDAPGKAGALIQTLVEVGRSYDVQVEHFLLSALRTYQQMNANYFADIEQAAFEFRQTRGWSAEHPIEEAILRDFLGRECGYSIEEEVITRHADLSSFRSVYIDGPNPVLHLNGRLLSMQKAFILAREIGYRTLGLGERAVTSSWLKIESFAQVLNNFKASYFAGALLIDRDALAASLRQMFAAKTWYGQALLATMSRFNATPEMFLYRLTELLPSTFGLEKIFFMRFHARQDSERVELTKVFNLSGVPVPYGLGLKEHYCRRWPGIRLVSSSTTDNILSLDSPDGATVAVQRSHFLEQDVEFFVISLARPLVLDPESRSSVSLGVLSDKKFRRVARYWDDPAVPRVEVNLTCERCPLLPEKCSDRVAEPEIYRQKQAQERKEEALAGLIT